MRTKDERGLTLIELAIVTLIMGIVLAMSIPAVGRFTQSQQLKGSTENVAAQLRLAREKAIATGTDITFHVHPNYLNTDYHVHVGTAIVGSWKLPKGVTFADYTGTVFSVVMRKDGTASNSLTVALADRRGNRDTVSVQASGLVLTR